MNNKFVIITASYNVEKWIGKTILSVQKQTYNNFKQIIIDDMSTDKTTSVANETIKGDNRFVLVQNKEKKC